jgi:hypothetical protein
MNPVVAARSRMYWAWWRLNRRPTDLSHGWETNSQWGTDFRRDYYAQGRLHYNVDSDKSPASEDLAEDVASELVRQRCSVLTDHGDLWLYGYSITEPYR